MRHERRQAEECGAWHRDGRLIAFLGSRLRYGMHEVAKRFIDDSDLGDIYRVNVKCYRRRGRPGIDILRYPLVPRPLGGRSRRAHGHGRYF